VEDGHDEMLTFHKRIAQVVQNLVAQGGKTILEPSLSNWQKDCILSNYLHRYMG
jgi:hypothetical protein